MNLGFGESMIVHEIQVGFTFHLYTHRLLMDALPSQKCRPSQYVVSQSSGRTNRSERPQKTQGRCSW